MEDPPMKDYEWPTISDEDMRAMLPTAKTYCLVILRTGPQKTMPRVEKIIWEHGRRNFALRAHGVLAIVCPVVDGSDQNGIYVFNASIEEVRKLMEEDPGVKAGAFTYELHACRGFPGQCLPG
jgi:hypothetical protein